VLILVLKVIHKSTFVGPKTRLMWVLYINSVIPGSHLLLFEGMQALGGYKD
jgi:hypothetical protein